MFKAKLRKIGNSQGIYIPKEVISNYKIGDILDMEVITSVITEQKVITDTNIFGTETDCNGKLIKQERKEWKWCKTHECSNFTCGCK